MLPLTMNLILTANKFNPPGSTYHTFSARCFSAFAIVLSCIVLIACDSGGAVVNDVPGAGGPVVVTQSAVEPQSEPVGTVAEQQSQPQREPQPEPITQQPSPVLVVEPETAIAPEEVSQSNSQLGPVVPLGVEDITDLVLVTGQSNALGAGTSYDQYIDSPNRQVFAFTDNGWQVADLNQVWDRGWFPRNDPNTDPSNNFSLHFGKRIAERRTDRVVGFILITAPGMPISHWQQDGQFFGDIRNKVSRAINELPYKSNLDVILWHQGESDGEDRDEYSAALYDLIERFRSEPWFGYGYPFICGETARSPVNQQLRKLNRDSDPWTACIAAEGLPTIRDNAHFSAESLRTMGKRYADAYLEMMLGAR